MTASKLDFETGLNNLKAHGFKTYSKPAFKLPYAKETLHEVMRQFIESEGVTFRWLPEYDKVADWLSDNNGTGLILAGSNGRGKSILGLKAFPYVFLNFYGLMVSTYHSTQINENLTTLNAKKVIYIDDVGRENVESKIYGNSSTPFLDLLDIVEKQSKLLILSTNANKEQLEARYDVRTMERLQALCRVVVFSGKSLRVKHF